MRTFTGLLIFLFIIGISSCGKKSEEQKSIEDAIEMVQKAPDMAKKVESIQQKAQKVWEERKQRGDTTAMNFRELQKYLPTEISGYTAEEPEGETVNMMGFSMTEVSRKFVRKSDDGQKEFIKVSINDYNSATSMFFGVAAWATMDYSVENADGWEKSFDPGVENCYGHEEFKTKTGNASIVVAAGYRFIISIDANHQTGTEKLKEVLKMIDLKKLANM